MAERNPMDDLWGFANYIHKGGRLTPAQSNTFDALLSKYTEWINERTLAEASDVARESVKRQILFANVVSADQVADDVLNLRVEEIETLITEEKPMTEEKPPGAFFDSLTRNNKQIRSDRAAAIAEDAQIMYRRCVEDLEVKIKRMTRDRENMLDLSPDNATSLKLASDFDSEDYVSKDIELGVNIRNAQIKLDIAHAQYVYLFGGV